jgi:outer membrane biosynthesis protein TonB
LNRSTAAFVIAFLFHILLLLIIFISARTIQIQPNNAKHEQRMKISLKEFPLTQKKEEVGAPKQPIQPQPQVPSQSKHVTQPLQKVEPKPAEQQFNKPNINQQLTQTPPKSVQQATQQVTQQPAQQIKTTQNVEKSTPTTPKTMEPINNTAKVQAPKEHAKLYKFLSQADSSQSNQPNESRSSQRSSQVDQDVKELYGAKFSQLSQGEQKYILDNMEIMRRITQETLNRVGSVNIPNNLRVNSINVIEFYLHPNGDMTDFKFLYNSNYYILDDTTRETIQYAYSKYPRPQQTTLIRYRVYYNLRGN